MLLRKQNVKAVLLYPNRKIERSSEDHGIIKFTFNIDDTRFERVAAVFVKIKGWVKISLPFCLVRQFCLKAGNLYDPYIY